jgi:CRP-like cAMP-binding protein
VLFQDKAAGTNQLLEALPGASRRRILAQAERVAVDPSRSLASRGEALAHAYFPTTSFVSLTVPSEKGRLEVALVGSEGFVGVPIALGVRHSAWEAVPQVAGEALRLRANVFSELLAEDGKLRALVDRYAYFRMTQLSRSALCHHHHLVEQRLARWLLASADRTRSAVIATTQSRLAELLGVRRVGVTTAVSQLQASRVVASSRGSITIRSREGLRRAACACYVQDLGDCRSVFA